MKEKRNERKIWNEIMEKENKKMPEKKREEKEDNKGKKGRE